MRFNLIALLALVVASTPSYAVDNYNPENNQLTIPAVQVGVAIYNDVVVTVDKILRVGSRNPVDASSTSASSATFNAYAAFQNMAKTGESITARFLSQSTTGTTCNGTATLVLLPALTKTIFDGQAAFSANRTTTQTSNNCPTRINQTTVYVSLDYMPLGQSELTNYNVYVGKASLPKSATVGDSGTLGVFNRYLNSSKTTFVGSTVVSYLFEPDTTASTIVLKLTHTELNTNGVVESTETARYRINAYNTMEFLSDEYISSYSKINFN